MPNANVKSYWSAGNLVFSSGASDVTAARIEYQGELRELWGTSTSSRNTYTTAADIVQFFVNNTAVSGICTGLDYEHAVGYQGSTTMQATAIRGVMRNLVGNTWAGSGYNEGAAGYILMGGTIDGGGHFYGVRGVVLNGGTWTACTEVAAGCFEYNNSSAVSSGKTAILLLKNNTSPPVTVDNVIYIYNGQAITYAFEFSTVGTAPVTTGSDSTNVTHKIAVKVGSSTGYLHVFSD